MIRELRARRWQRFEEGVRAVVGLEEGVEPAAERDVARAGAVEEGFAVRAVHPLERLAEEDFFPVVSRFHR